MKIDLVTQNKNVVRNYTQRFNAGDLDGLVRLFSPEAVIHGVLGWGALADVVPVWQSLMQNLRMTLTIDELIGQRNVVVARFLETGTSRGTFFDQPATGRSYKLTALEWFEFDRGLIQRRWGARDAVSQARQLGWTQPAERQITMQVAV